MSIKSELKETFRVANGYPPDNMKAVHLARLKIGLLTAALFGLVMALATVVSLLT